MLNPLRQRIIRPLRINQRVHNVLLLPVVRRHRLSRVFRKEGLEDGREEAGRVCGFGSVVGFFAAEVGVGWGAEVGCSGLHERSEGRAERV